MKNSNICVSVIMSIYNEKEDWLKASINSILNQTYKNFEFIIVNDNPQRLINRIIVQQYERTDKRIIYIENIENLGLTKSLNIGIKNAKGDFIARMDADDISLPTRFEKQIDYLKKNLDVIAIGTWINFFGDIKKSNKEYRTDKEEVKNFLMIYTPIAHPTAMIRREVFYKHGIFYNEDYKYAQDYEFFYQLSKVGKLSNIPEILLNYRSTETQISNQNISPQKELATKLRKTIISEMIGSDLILELGLFKDNSRIKIFKDIKSYSLIIRKDNPILEKRLQILKYVLLMSPRSLSDRLVFLFLLLINPFQKIGFSFRYYLKAIYNQLFASYNTLL